VVRFNREWFEFGREPFARFEPSVRPGDALRTVIVGSERAEFLQFGDSALGVDIHCWPFVAHALSVPRRDSSRRPYRRRRHECRRGTHECVRHVHLKIYGLTLQHPPATALAHEFAIANLYLSADRYYGRPPLDLESFKTVVIAVG